MIVHSTTEITEVRGGKLVLAILELGNRDQSVLLNVSYRKWLNCLVFTYNLFFHCFKKINISFYDSPFLEQIRDCHDVAHAIIFRYLEQGTFL